MTVVPRRAAPRVRRRPTLADRFPLGLEVEVSEDFSDPRYRGYFGKVVEVVFDPTERHYPTGRIAVLLNVDAAWAAGFGYTDGSNRPNPVWFRPSSLTRR